MRRIKQRLMRDSASRHRSQGRNKAETLDEFPSMSESELCNRIELTLESDLGAERGREEVGESERGRERACPCLGVRETNVAPSRLFFSLLLHFPIFFFPGEDGAVM